MTHPSSAVPAPPPRQVKLGDILILLSRTAPFRGLGSKRLGLFSDHFEGVAFDEGDVLLEEGSLPAGIHIILRGSLQVVLPRRPDRGREADISLGTLKAGDCFGEYSIIDEQEASASVVAVRAGELIRIPTAQFNVVLEQNRDIAMCVYRNLMRILIARLRDSGKDFEVFLRGG